MAWGTAPHRNAAGRWVTQEGRALSAAGSKYWAGRVAAGLFDTSGHRLTTPSAYRQGSRNALLQMQRGGGLGGQVPQSAAARAIHNAAVLWAATAPKYFPGRRMPTLDVTTQGVSDPRAPMPNLAATWAPGNPRLPWRAARDNAWVGLGPDVIHDLGRSLLSPGASRVMLHEWAHAMQSPRTFAKGYTAEEGGAEAFARAALPNVLARLGVSPAYGQEQIGPAWLYPDQVAAVRRRHTPAWIERGQFR